MLVIKIELHPHGYGGSHVRELGRMVIANVGGTDELGDYEVKTRDGRRIGHPAAIAAGGGIWEQPQTRDVIDHPERTGTVTGHAREREPVWALVAKALYAIGFDKFGRRSCPKHWGDADDICMRPLGHDGPCGGFYQCITCQPGMVPERERAVIRAVQRHAWHMRRSWLFWFRLDPLGTLGDSYSGHDAPVTKGEP